MAWATRGETRAEAALRRAGVDRLARVDEALAQVPTIAATVQRKAGRRPQGPRASTTDPDARIMKMADGALDPATTCTWPRMSTAASLSACAH
jgi:hypothetical protein